MGSEAHVKFSRQLGYLEIQLSGEFQDRDLGDTRQRFDRAFESFQPEAEGLHHVFWVFERARLVSENMFAAFAGYMVVLRLRGARSLVIAPTRLLEGYLIRSGLDSLIATVSSEDEAFRRALEGTRRDYGPEFLDYLVENDYLTPDQRRRVDEEIARNPHPGVTEDVLIDAGYLTHRSLFALHHQYARARGGLPRPGQSTPRDVTSGRSAGLAGTDRAGASGSARSIGPAGAHRDDESVSGGYYDLSDVELPGGSGAGRASGDGPDRARVNRSGPQPVSATDRTGAAAPGRSPGPGSASRGRASRPVRLPTTGSTTAADTSAPAHLAGRVKPVPPGAPPPSPASEFVRPRLVGQLLVEHRLISEEQLKEALEIQRREGRDARLGDILVRCGYVKDWDLFQMLEKQHRRKDGPAARNRPAVRGGLVRSRLLGQILVDLEILSESGLKLALVEQRKNPREKIGDILLRLNLLNRDQLLDALQIQKERAG